MSLLSLWFPLENVQIVTYPWLVIIDCIILSTLYTTEPKTWWLILLVGMRLISIYGQLNDDAFTLRMYWVGESPLPPPAEPGRQGWTIINIIVLYMYLGHLLMATYRHTNIIIFGFIAFLFLPLKSTIFVLLATFGVIGNVEVEM